MVRRLSNNMSRKRKSALPGSNASLKRPCFPKKQQASAHASRSGSPPIDEPRVVQRRRTKAQIRRKRRNAAKRLSTQGDGASIAPERASSVPSPKSDSDATTSKKLATTHLMPRPRKAWAGDSARKPGAKQADAQQHEPSAEHAVARGAEGHVNLASNGAPHQRSPSPALSNESNESESDQPLNADRLASAGRPAIVNRDQDRPTESFRLTVPQKSTEGTGVTSKRISHAGKANHVPTQPDVPDVAATFDLFNAAVEANASYQSGEEGSSSISSDNSTKLEKSVGDARPTSLTLDQGSSLKRSKNEPDIGGGLLKRRGSDRVSSPTDNEVSESTLSANGSLGLPSASVKINSGSSAGPGAQHEKNDPGQDKSTDELMVDVMEDIMNITTPLPDSKKSPLLDTVDDGEQAGNLTPSCSIHRPTSSRSRRKRKEGLGLRSCAQACEAGETTCQAAKSAARLTIPVQEGSPIEFIESVEPAVCQRISALCFQASSPSAVPAFPGILAPSSHTASPCLSSGFEQPSRVAHSKLSPKNDSSVSTSGAPRKTRKMTGITSKHFALRPRSPRRSGMKSSDAVSQREACAPKTGLALHEAETIGRKRSTKGPRSSLSLAVKRAENGTQTCKKTDDAVDSRVADTFPRTDDKQAAANEGTVLLAESASLEARVPQRTPRTRRTTAKRSPYFTPSTPLLDPNVIDRVDFYNFTGKKKGTPPGTSAAPVPSITCPTFGIIQEKLWREPFWLLIAVTFLNKTAGRAATPVFWQLKERYKTPEALAEADPKAVQELIRHLGLQTHRSQRIIKIAAAWTSQPPEACQRYRTLHYPSKQDGKQYKATQAVEEDSDQVGGALEIGHIPGCGPYAWDSWRIFCRDPLRRVADDYNGTNAARADFVPEWQRVVPLDKELRACLRWMWLRERWIWNHETGEKRPATEEEMQRAVQGEMDVADAQEGAFAPRAAGVTPQLSGGEEEGDGRKDSADHI